MGKITAIANQKGGVGKTTTAVNLCASLAAAERKTLLVDMDPQGNAGSGVGVDKRELGTTVYETLLDSTAIDTAVVTTVLDHLYLLPSDGRLTGAEIELTTQDRREFRLQSALERIKDQYEFVYINCPPGMGLLTLNALTAADSVIIPVQCEYYALEGLGQLLETIRLVQTRLNPKLEIEGVLLTMFDRRLNLARQVVDDAIEYFGNKVYETIIPRNVKLSESPSYGKPILLYDAQSQGAQTYLKLAREVINSVEESVR
ncbi:MAG: AAA family ATPase [bacterium]